MCVVCELEEMFGEMLFYWMICSIWIIVFG